MSRTRCLAPRARPALGFAKPIEFRQPEITAISWQFNHMATLWVVPGAGGQTAFAFQDTYTYPTLSQVTTAPTDALLSPPGLVGAWVDANGDGLSDLFAYSDISFNAQAPLKLYLRSGTAPFSLDSGTAVKTTSGAAVQVCGFCLVDVDKDGHPDLVTGAPSGESGPCATMSSQGMSRPRELT